MDPHQRRTDEDLLLRSRKGDRTAFASLVRRYEREMYGYLKRYLGDSSLAEDVFQNTFLQLYLKSDQYQPGNPVRPWLYTIATHQAIDAMRRNGRHRAVSLDEYRESSGEDESQRLMELLEDRETGPLEQAHQQEQRELVRAGVELLPDFLKQVLILAYYQGLKYKDVADMLGIPVGTVKSRLHAALVRLHEIWNASNSLQER